MTAEQERLARANARLENWQRWGPYLAERQWGTVREDYSPDGNAWESFPHDDARSRAYRWGEDGLLGITDRECRLCFALALWNGRDPILKERLFGLTNTEGNHGEDVKEEYFYLDSTPTHAYMKGVYRYPQAAFPYDQLVAVNRRRGLGDREFKLRDTGVLDDNRFFDVTVEYAKAAPDDVLIRITAQNRGPDAATLHLLPTLWFRNTWSWGCKHEGCSLKPRISLAEDGLLHLTHETLGTLFFRYGPGPDETLPPILFTDNETNEQRLYGAPTHAYPVKDAFHAYVISGEQAAVSIRPYGTKAAAHHVLRLDAGASAQIRLRLTAGPAPGEVLGSAFDEMFDLRRKEADDFYASVLPAALTDDARTVARQAYAGLLWSKQFYHHITRDWLEGDPALPPPPEARKRGRNAEWEHLFCRDILSVPDKWEYPWFAAWDLAFHMLPFARIDPEFAKAQLLLLLREWYMHPNGQIPAYEYAFGDVNPPVQAWAAWRVYKIAAPRGARDQAFLERSFQKLLINFTWWVNRKDANGRNLFSGGFLGLDNVGVFDRSKPLPAGGTLEQADGTAWMAFYCLTMMSMAMELALENSASHNAYEDMASKFFEHFIQISDAINALGGCGLWDGDDGFYYDQIAVDRVAPVRLKVRSMVGLLPLIAVTVLEQERIDRLPGFKKRFEWFIANRPDLARHISWTQADCRSGQNRWLLALPSKERLTCVLRYMLDESEFLSPFGIRSLSRFHAEHPFVFHACGGESRIAYVPGESDSRMFGGNSNWRGPVWFPVNYLLVEALEIYHHYYGDDFRVEYPAGSGNLCTLLEIANDLSLRLARLFLSDAGGHRPCEGNDGAKERDHVLFHEYFDGDTGRGLGASHQTGWTALVTRFLENAFLRP